MKAEPAHSIIRFLGGAARVAELLGCDVTRVYRWQYPAGRSEGKGGFVPSKDAFRLLQFAKEQGIDLRADDFFDSDRLRMLLDQLEAAE